MKKFSKKQWIKFSIAAVLYLLFTLWMQNAWLLLGLIVLVDIFLTGYIPWGAWKRTKNPQVRNVLEWVDDILFALVAVYFINIFIFQNYQIPSSSLEKSLLVGDYLFVSKLSYGPRVPNTPVAFPLVQNTLPFFNCKSYLDWPEWDYKRVKGLGHVKRNDIVVFNFPAGDTVALKVQNPDYYHLVDQYGREAILLNKADFGDVIYRPVDKRENLSIKWNDVIYYNHFKRWVNQLKFDFSVDEAKYNSNEEFNLMKRSLINGKPETHQLQSIIDSIPYHKKMMWENQIWKDVHLKCFLIKNKRKVRELESGERISKNVSLRFEAYSNNISLYKIYWQITNTGFEAQQFGQLRGDFYDSELVEGNQVRNESTAYFGKHYVEAFLVNEQNQCVGRSYPFVVNIE